MENVIIREKLQEYINNGDDRLLKLMYAVAKEYTEIEEDYELSAEQIAELDIRREKRISGESKGYSWIDAKKIITGEKKLKELIIKLFSKNRTCLQHLLTCYK